MDKKVRTTIKLNGQKYNALSGQQIGAVKRIGNIDGIVMHPTHKPSMTRTRPLPTAVKKPSATTTLMRAAVTKPTKSSRLISRVNAPLTLDTTNPIKTPLMAGIVDQKLARRAMKVKLNNKISRFGAPVPTTATISSNPYSAPLKMAPKEAMPKAEVKPKDIFEHAIEQANSHQQPTLTKKELKQLHGRKPFKKSIAGYTVAGFVALIIIGYGAYASMPNVMVKVASIRAGFAASLPAYHPSGYSLASVGYSPGRVAFNFNSNIDSRNFKLTEQSSNWDSATLVSSIIMPAQGNNYKKLMVNGQTVYLFGQDMATWVSNGIRYQVQGNGSLSTNQLVKLATNL